MVEVITKASDALHNNYILMIGAAVFLVVYILKNVEKIDNKLLPVISCVVGIAVGIFATWVTGANIAIGVYDGFIAGLIASGGKDLITVITAVVSGKIKNWDDVVDVLDDGEINGSNKKQDF